MGRSRRAGEGATLLLGLIAVAAAAFVAGTSGFGFGLLATPLLLALGFSLPFVITVNLLISVATRVAVAYRLREHVHPGHAALLVGGAIPGLYLGTRTLGAVDDDLLETVAGAVVMVAAALLAARRAAAAETHAGASAAAGFLGGFLGTTTSLIGVPPALLLTRAGVVASAFFADLAVYFVAAGAAGLALLVHADQFSSEALFPAFALWLPAVLVANRLGTSVGLRLPQERFRLLALGVAFAAGAATVATA